MKKLGFMVFAVVLGITVFTACGKKEAAKQNMEAAPAVAEQQAPAPAPEAAPAPPTAPAASKE